jgi:hypothetical protein
MNMWKYENADIYEITDMWKYEYEEIYDTKIYRKVSYSI